MTNTSNSTSRNRLTRQQLELINRRTIRYPLQIAEKDYFLGLAIQLVYNSSLVSKLIFKGGTALHHCYLPQKRFSDDLDFTSIDLGSIYCSEDISNKAVENLIQDISFDDLHSTYQNKEKNNALER